jgi:hypothetical protein
MRALNAFHGSSKTAWRRKTVTRLMAFEAILDRDDAPRQLVDEFRVWGDMKLHFIVVDNADLGTYVLDGRGAAVRSWEQDVQVINAERRRRQDWTIFGSALGRRATPRSGHACRRLALGMICPPIDLFVGILGRP